MTSPYETLREDSYLGPLVDQHGRLDLDPADDMFERLVVSILRQQVSMASAAATRERLFEAVEVTPEGILAADPGTLRDAGLSRQKTGYVRNVAEAFRDEFSKDYFEELDDEAVVDELTEIKGVGEWTARMQLLFSLGRPDVFPVGDLGIRKGMRTLYGEDLNRAEMVEEAERWAPYRSYASLYLWRVEEDIADSVAEVVGE
ncbi:DNA-3-methyladenine glycosylase family protein [Natronomonas amylolytica]|uniref:DNA-3-methyladenine glycosylase family protein n=1 Tax=Natronomonas amylolytica TaxID=3108498 RepID=UPI0030087CC0